MIRLRAVVGLALATAVLGWAGVVAAACTPETLMELRVYAKVNEFRRAAGLPELRADPALARVAKYRSQDMVASGYFGHTNPSNGATVFTLMDQWGIPYAWAGENLAWNSYPVDRSPDAVVDGWTKSPSHRANLLGAHYERMGVGVAVTADGTKYYTLVVEGAIP